MPRMISDPIEFELFKNSLFSIADEMALTIFRTTYSGVLKDNMDYSTAMFDGSGKLAAQGLTLPGHLGSMPTAMAAIQEAFAGKIEPGDVFILNDPFQGGMHLPDIFVFRPIFCGGELLAWAGTVCHHTDVGGRVPGSNASDSTEIYQEGLRIPPLKLFDRGTRNDTLWALVERNVRVPVKVFGDLRAQLAACHISERSLIELAGHYGVEKVEHYMTELIDYSERMTRAAIRELPDGVYSFLDHIDDDGIDVGRPIPLSVAVTKSGDRMSVDWTGSSPQVKGAINNTLSFTKSASYCAIRSILPADIPNNEGVFRAIEVTAPPGTIANAVLPAACAARCPTRCSPAPTAATPGSRSAAGTPTGGPSSMSISPAAPGADALMPTVSTAILTSTPTWPRNRSRSPRPSSRSRSPPMNSSRMRWAPANFAAVRRSAVITVSWPTRASCRCAPTAATFDPTGYMAVVRASRR